MSGALRFRLAVLILVLAGLSTSSASANLFTALFNPAPEDSPAPAPAKDAPAEDECLSRPGKPADGQHWVYRRDGHRKCWFQAAEGTATVKKRAHHHAAKRRPAVADEDEAAPRKRKSIADARAELLRPDAAETPPTPTPPPAPAFKVVDAATDSATGAAALVPPPPVLVKPDQLSPDQSSPRQDNLETLFAATPADSEAIAASAPSASPVASVTPAAPVAAPMVEPGADSEWWTARWLGPLFMVLGLVCLLSSSEPVRRTMLAARRLWAREGEGPEELVRSSEPDLQTHPDGRYHAQATPRSSRPAIEDRRTSRPPGQGLVPRVSFAGEEDHAVRARLPSYRELGQRQISERQISERQVSERQVSERQVSERQIGQRHVSQRLPERMRTA